MAVHAAWCVWLIPDPKSHFVTNGRCIVCNGRILLIVTKVHPRWPTGKNQCLLHHLFHHLNHLRKLHTFPCFWTAGIYAYGQHVSIALNAVVCTYGAYLHCGGPFNHRVMTQIEQQSNFKK